MNHFRAAREGRMIVSSRVAAKALGIVVLLSAPATLSGDERPPIVFEADRILAKVDSEEIVAGDVVLGAMAEFNKVKQELESREYEASYEQALKSQIGSLVKVKLLYLQARRVVSDDKLSKLIETIGREFDEKALEDFLERTDCADRRELEAKLKPMGSSLARIKRNFVESQIAEQWFRDQVHADDIEVTRDETLARYQDNQTIYAYPAKARYEELVMRPSDLRDARQAQAALAQLGERVKKGAAWADVAKARSEGTTASQGGRQPWISQGSHRSAVIDRALFSLEVGAMSPVLKDDKGFYVIRVIERRPAGLVPFDEVAGELAQEIRQERFRRLQVDYMKKLFAEARVWSIFD